MATVSYIGKGEIYVGPYGNTDALRSIGNASKLELGVDEEKKELLDFTAAGGGLANSITRVKSVTGSITLHDLSVENLSLALRGTSSSAVGGAVTDEQHTAWHGGLVAFAGIPDAAQSVTVTNSGATVTYVENTDYTRVRAGIVILATGAITDGQTILVDYTSKTRNVLEALTNSGAEFRVVFDGMNEANNSSEVVVTFHRVKFSPVQGLSLIGDDFAGLELSFDSLSDAAIVGGGLSKFMKVQQV